MVVRAYVADVSHESNDPWLWHMSSSATTNASPFVQNAPSESRKLGGTASHLSMKAYCQESLDCMVISSDAVEKN